MILVNISLTTIPICIFSNLNVPKPGVFGSHVFNVLNMKLKKARVVPLDYLFLCIYCYALLEGNIENFRYRCHNVATHKIQGIMNKLYLVLAHSFS
jgi:hypothetical protein